MKPLIIYHDNCADGFGAAWAAYKKFGADGAEYLPMNYNDPRVSVAHDELTFPTDILDRDVYILDFSFPKDVMLEIELLARKFVLLDHHKTVFEQYGLDPKTRFVQYGERGTMVILDPDKSGCVLAWEHFHPDAEVPGLLRYIEDRDLWRWQLTCTRDLATGLRSKPFTFDWFDIVDADVGAVMDKGEAMNELFDQQLADVVKRPVQVVLIGQIGMSVNCTPQFASEAGNELAKKSGAFGMTWFAGNDGQVFVSLRSIGDYDVSEIAKAYGGGGHRNASGFNTTWEKVSFSVDGMVIQPPKNGD